MARAATDPNRRGSREEASAAHGLWTRYLRTLLAAAAYRPERHYMRGRPAAGDPGPGADGGDLGRRCAGDRAA